jgi:hypothetical protein
MVDHRAGFGWWVDGKMGVKLNLRDCLAQSKNVFANLIAKTLKTP